MLIRDIMSAPAITVRPDARIAEVARLMREEQISGVPVVDANGQLHGLITEHDLISRHAPIREPAFYAVLSGVIPLSLDSYRLYREQLRQTLAVTADQLMRKVERTVAPDATVESVMVMMLDEKVELLPVVDGGGLLGVVTRTDLVRLINSLEMAVDEEAASAVPEALRLIGLREVVLYVEDMNAMVAFYRDTMGLTLQTPLEVTDFSAEQWVVFDTGVADLALHGGGQKRLGADSPMLVFFTRDIAAHRDELVAKGMVWEDIVEAAPGIRVCHGRDPEGTPLALEQRVG